MVLSLKLQVIQLVDYLKYNSAKPTLELKVNHDKAGWDDRARTFLDYCTYCLEPVSRSAQFIFQTEEPSSVVHLR